MLWFPLLPFFLAVLRVCPLVYAWRERQEAYALKKQQKERQRNTPFLLRFFFCFSPSSLSLLYRTLAVSKGTPVSRMFRPPQRFSQLATLGIMLQATLVTRLFSKPIAQGYVAQLPRPLPGSKGRSWMRAMDANSDVRDFYTADEERYNAWYRETYGIEDLSDGSAASGAASNRLLDDTRNMQQAAEEYDLQGMREELEFWGDEFQHMTQLR
ncbi:LOW QUALITY PROTEIN: hypothetical protein Q4I30_003906 [Leishmania utingensis]|uniref:Uncharacterized protein n=1 Tax=Leishmania utingensis TaxID=653362 RepID=A0AAW3AJD4_9TRYP